jgi:cytochrome c oxidase subunit 2
LYWVLAVAAGAITIGALVFFVTKYRARSGSGLTQQEEDEKIPIRTVLVIVIVMASVLAGAGYASFHAIGVYNNPPNGWSDLNALHVNVTGQRFSWSFNCTSGCGVPAVLTVPRNKIVILNITSIDVFHSLGIPDLRVKADAIPGRYNMVWFQVSTPGTYRILCYELCGSGHAFMIAKLVVT